MPVVEETYDIVVVGAGLFRWAYQEELATGALALPHSARGEHVADGFIRIRNVYHVPNGSPYGAMLKKVYNYIGKYGNNEKNQSRRCI